ncbi:MAG TPA: carboxypeptidase-like regulatory domain-containing protein [Bacteroidales bacterium]|nr:carboxypeptidase-like regulatory domain-containing protein [Bacteroidales bacterium]
MPQTLTKISALLILSLLAPDLYAQEDDHDLVQFSGLVVTGDSLKAVPFTHILIKNRRRGLSSDYNGFFSFVAQKGDTILFSSVGFKKSEFVIPDTITTRRYSMVQMMTTDTIMLAETVIYPWPSREQFREAFINTRPPDDDLVVAQKNLEFLEMRDRTRNMPMDGSQNYRHFMQQQTDRLYYYGQSPPISVFNPFAWAKFFEAWKNGDFRKKD